MPKWAFWRIADSAVLQPISAQTPVELYLKAGLDVPCFRGCPVNWYKKDCIKLETVKIWGSCRDCDGVSCDERLQLAIDRSSLDLQQTVCPQLAPAHLLLLAHPPVDQLVDRRFHVRRGHSFLLSKSLRVSTYSRLVGIEIRSQFIEL